ncbi:hypothetical protein D3C73_1212740 [compost metagenome]
MSWAKFLGTPPPTMNRAVVPAAILMSVSSRKSAIASIIMYGLPSLARSFWCLTRPKPAELSTKAGQKIGTPFS